MPAGDAGQIDSRIPELDGQAERAERQQQVGDLRMRDRAQHLLRPGHVDVRAWRLPVCKSCSRPSNRRIVRPSSFRSKSGTSVAITSMSGGAAPPLPVR